MAHLIKNTKTSIHDVNEQSKNGLGMIILPNPSDDQLSIKFDLDVKTEVRLKVMDMQGKILNTFNYGHLSSGAHHFNISEDFKNQNILIFQLQAGDKISTQKVVIK
ncbi:MAG: T9SS type A sorting domain-containing protein [Saprospiraceae bacterium]